MDVYGGLWMLMEVCLWMLMDVYRHLMTFAEVYRSQMLIAGKVIELYGWSASCLWEKTRKKCFQDVVDDSYLIFPNVPLVYSFVSEKNSSSSILTCSIPHLPSRAATVETAAVEVHRRWCQLRDLGPESPASCCSAFGQSETPEPSRLTQMNLWKLMGCRFFVRKKEAKMGCRSLANLLSTAWFRGPMIPSRPRHVDPTTSACWGWSPRVFRCAPAFFFPQVQVKIMPILTWRPKKLEYELPVLLGKIEGAVWYAIDCHLYVYIYVYI